MGNRAMTEEQRSVVTAALDCIADEALRRYARGEYPIVLTPFMEPKHGDGVMHSSTVEVDTTLLTRRCTDALPASQGAQAAAVLAATAGSAWVKELANRQPEQYGGSRALEALLGIAEQVVASSVSGTPRLFATQAAIARFERFCAIEKILWTVSAPLSGVSVVDGPHAVSGRVVMRAADDDFKKALWAAHGPGATPWATLGDEEASRVARLDAVIETTFTTERDGWPSSPDANQRIAAVLSALRIHGAQRVSAKTLWTHGPAEIGTFTRAPSSSLARTQPFLERYNVGPNFVLDPGLARDLRGWIQLREQRRSEDAVAFAIQRFDLADERVADSDRLVDAWIALESLFSNKGEGGELTYRIALRLATLLGEDANDRKAIRSAATRSYGLRSTIVHGALLSKHASTLVGITAQTEDMVRRTIRTWVGSEFGDPDAVIEDIEARLTQ